jgi:hypothetical protein
MRLVTYLGTRTDISNVATKRSSKDFVPGGGGVPLKARAPKTAETNIGAIPMAGNVSFASRPQGNKSENAKGKTTIVVARS